MVRNFGFELSEPMAFGISGNSGFVFLPFNGHMTIIRGTDAPALTGSAAPYCLTQARTT